MAELKNQLDMKLYINLFLCMILIFVGGMIYVIFRDENILLFYWFNKIGLNDFVVLIRQNLYSPLISNSFPWFIYSLPNLLWFTSGLIIINAIWKDNNNLDGFIWLFIFSSIGIVSELFQMFGLLAGTYDNLDLFPMIIILSIFIIKNLMERNSSCQDYLKISHH